MNILVLSNFYPPYYIGGYELGCQEIVESLKQRGHTVKVLTSRYGVDRPEQDGDVYRWLRSDLGWSSRSPAAYWHRLFVKELYNRLAFRRLLRRFTPQVFHIWNPRSISVAPVYMAQRMGIPVCYAISDDWLAHSETIDRWYRPPPNRVNRAIWRLLDLILEAAGGRTGQQHLRLDYVQFTSQYLKDAAAHAGKPVERARVAHWGVDLLRFPFRAAPRECARKLLYVGQLTAKKGVATAIEALHHLIACDPGGDLSLTIAGGAIAPGYEAELRALVRDAQLESRVSFAGKLPRDQLPALYQDHDILIFPSIWEEPFSITLLEAMASGLAVVATATGGSAELLRHNHNALIFPPADAEACAAQLAALLNDQVLFERIRSTGRETIERHYTIAQMADRIEALLRDTAGGAHEDRDLA